MGNVLQGRDFRVFAVSTVQNGFGLFGYILIDKDGVAYQVGRAPDIEPALSVGDTIYLKFRCNKLGEDDPEIVRCVWDEYNFEMPGRLPDAPKDIVDKIWGDKC